ncbi:MAG TPA: hypothetical protein VMY35_17780 [Phycisphaerae bacterium]|nr:hypothetical protein [Phycisphaerae bacterium]
MKKARAIEFACGMMLMAVGASWAWPPAGLIVLGLLIVTDALLGER